MSSAKSSVSQPPHGGAATPKKSRRGSTAPSSAKTVGVATNKCTNDTTNPTTQSAFSSSDVLLTRYPVHTLPYLQELLRPNAASRLAAAAQLVDMAAEVAGATVHGGGRSVSATAAGSSAPDSGSASATPLPPPPPSYAVAAAAAVAAAVPAGPAAATTGSSENAVKDTRSESSSSAAPRASKDSPAASSPHQHGSVDTSSGKQNETDDATVDSNNNNNNNDDSSNNGAAPTQHQPTVPSQALLLACTTQLGGLLAQWRTCNAAGRRDAWGRPPPLPPPASAPATSAAVAGGGNKKGFAGPPAFPANHPQQQQPVRPSAERVLQLMEVILWYCLSTSDDVRLAYGGGRSHGTSGRATPALPGTAAALQYSQTSAQASAGAAVGGSSTPFGARGTTSGGVNSYGANSRGGRGASVGRSGSSSADPLNASDWLGSRMSNSAASSSVGVPTVSMTDDQLAEHLFRPVVDAVVLLQDRPALSSTANAMTTAAAAAEASKGNSNEPNRERSHNQSSTSSKKAERSEEMEAETCEELQTVALWTLAAVLVRFAEAPFNATVFLPVLFPQVDVRGANGLTARHPILQPLLRGDTAQVSATHTGAPAVSSNRCGAHTSLRCGAAAALTALLHKLQPTLQYAEEPHPNRQAFVSLATQCGTMLLSLHESLCWGLENEGRVSHGGSSNSAANSTTPATANANAILNTSMGGRGPALGENSALPLLSTYAAVVGVTPYNRCPRSRAVVLQTLQLPVIRTYLAHGACSEYVPTTVLVSSVFKNESMRGAAAQLLSESSNNSIANAADRGSFQVTGVHADGSGGNKNNNNNNNNYAAEKQTFLSALLLHADTRVEVWRCMVPLSRLYPRMVHSEFDSLMAASVRVVATLVEWEAAEEAAEAAALAEKKLTEAERETEPSAARDGSATPRHETQRATASSVEASPATTPARAVRSVHGDPNHNGSGGGNAEDTKEGESQAVHAAGGLAEPPFAASALLLARVGRPLPAAAPEALAECLRTWLHFMGYVWKAFDDNACDPALRPEGQQDRATLAQKHRIHDQLLRPAMRLRRCGEEVRSMTLRCIAQIGNDYLSTLTNPRLGEELVAYVQTCLADPQPRVRGEALTTLGMWLWQYPSMDAFACVAIDNAVHSLTVDPNALVRTKAAFALSNITGRLPEGTCPTVRENPIYIATLCATAMHAAVIDSESGVQGHGIRMMNHLLQVLDFEELISEVAEFEEGVAEGFLRVLLECLRAATRGNTIATTTTTASANSNGGSANGWYVAPREAKHRWNAAYALGMGLAREEVFEAEPKYAVEAVDALCTAVVRDHIFKVRTQAAGALGRIPGDCLCATYSTEDLTPKVVRSLCEALETATSTENFRQYKEQGSLHDALHGALATMITTAKPSIELDKVFASYQKLLQKEQLL